MTTEPTPALDSETLILAMLEVGANAQPDAQGNLPPDAVEAIRDLARQPPGPSAALSEAFGTEPPGPGWVSAGGMRWVKEG